MPDIFPYSSKVSKAATRDSKPNVVAASFGGGYSQRISQGINTLAEEWDLSFSSQPLNIADGIVTFLESKRGVDSFFFNPPFSSATYLVTCSEWSTEYESHISKTIKAKFIRVYDLI